MDPSVFVYLKKAAGFMWLTGEGKKAAGFTMCEKFFNFGIGGSTREISSSGLFGRLRVFGDGREARELEVEPSSESSHSPSTEDTLLRVRVRDSVKVRVRVRVNVCTNKLN